jgi:hypothetical protein
MNTLTVGYLDQNGIWQILPNISQTKLAQLRQQYQAVVILVQVPTPGLLGAPPGSQLSWADAGSQPSQWPPGTQVVAGPIGPTGPIGPSTIPSLPTALSQSANGVYQPDPPGTPLPPVSFNPPPVPSSPPPAPPASSSPSPLPASPSAVTPPMPPEDGHPTVGSRRGVQILLWGSTVASIGAALTEFMREIPAELPAAARARQRGNKVVTITFTVIAGTATLLSALSVGRQIARGKPRS